MFPKCVMIITSRWYVIHIVVYYGYSWKGWKRHLLSHVVYRSIIPISDIDDEYMGGWMDRLTVGTPYEHFVHLNVLDIWHMNIRSWFNIVRKDIKSCLKGKDLTCYRKICKDSSGFYSGQNVYGKERYSLAHGNRLFAIMCTIVITVDVNKYDAS